MIVAIVESVAIDLYRYSYWAFSNIERGNQFVNFG